MCFVVVVVLHLHFFFVGFFKTFFFVCVAYSRIIITLLMNLFTHLRHLRHHLHLLQIETKENNRISILH